MNRYFTDAWYHAKRAGENAYRGLREALWPAERKVRELAGWEIDEEPTRMERVRERLERAEDRAELRAREVFEAARRRVRTVR